jgi:hypothetical protein
MSSNDLPPAKVRRRIQQLFAMLGSSNANERESAHNKLNELLRKHGLSWNDLPRIMAAVEDDERAKSPPPPPSPQGPPSPSDRPEVNVLVLVERLLELHITLHPAQRLATALWVLHTHVFDRYAVTPRLALLSAVRGCGKTTLLELLEWLTFHPYRSDNVSPALIYHQLSSYGQQTLLLDEADNLGLLDNPTLRAVFNAGHRRGGAVGRLVGGRPRKFPVFAPLAVAAIGLLPLPLLHRSVIINMQRASDTEQPALKLDPLDPSFPATREQIRRWTLTCSLNLDPDMPLELRNRAADNWRPLLAIADDLGRGEEARAAAVALTLGHLDEDPGVILLFDIRSVFERLGVDRITSANLIEALLELEDAPWSEWRGPNDDRSVRKLSQLELARMLRSFAIKPRSIWQPGGKTRKGYLREQFVAAWSTYCSTPGRPAGTSKIKALGSV